MAIMAAALTAAGKYCAKTDQWQKAFQNMYAAIGVSGFSPRVIGTLVHYILQLDQPEKAKDVLKKFPAEQRGSSEFLCLEFFVVTARADAQKVVATGQKLIDGETASVKVFLKVIESAVELNREMMINTLVQKAVKAYPKEKAKFLALVESEEENSEDESTEPDKKKE
jgi:hypothetical protein